MIKQIAHWISVVFLIVWVGGHYALLQSCAWVGMAITYSQQTSSLTEAIQMTFDGQHPCRLCKLVDDCRKTEKTKESQVTNLKLDFLLSTASLELWVPKASPVRIAEPIRIPVRHEAPPLPPPLSLA